MINIKNLIGCITFLTEQVVVIQHCVFYPKKGNSLTAHIYYAIFSELFSASAMSSIVVSTTHTVLGPVLGVNDLLLPILREHVANSVCSLFFRRLRRAYPVVY